MTKSYKYGCVLIAVNGMANAEYINCD